MHLGVQRRYIQGMSTMVRHPKTVSPPRRVLRRAAWFMWLVVITGVLLALYADGSVRNLGFSLWGAGVAAQISAFLISLTFGTEARRR